MKFYKITEKENGDKILKKLKNAEIKDIQELKKYDFKKSSIIECDIDNDKYEKLKYKSILCKIYEIINDGTKIIKNTKLNIKTIKKEDEGFYYMDNLGISIQGCDSNKCIVEIINQCIENEISLKMKIKLMDDLTLNINF